MSKSPYRTARDDAREASGVAWGWIFGAGGSLVALFFGLHLLGVFGSVTSAPGRVVSRTMETDNIITRYEWFHDANGVYRSRIAQIAAKRKDLAAPDNDQTEKFRLRTELSAMQQSCRDLANRYNANATKTNQSIFMGRDAPTGLNPTACE